MRQPIKKSLALLLALCLTMSLLPTAALADGLKTVYRLQLAGMINMESVTGYERKIYLFFQEVQERGIQKGKFNTALSPEALSRHFVMAIRGLTYEWCIRYPNFDFKQEALAHFQLLLEGIRT